MKKQVEMGKKYQPSEDIVAREIEGELIIVPLTAGIGDTEDDLFTLNETGKDIWALLNKGKSLLEIVADLTKAYEGDTENIEKDVEGFVSELLNRGMLTEI